MAPTSFYSPLHPRQNTVVTSPTCSGLDGGGIAGVVIGSVLGTLLIVWIIDRMRKNARDRDARVVSTVDARRRRRRSSRAYSVNGGGGGRGSRRGSMIESTSAQRTFVGEDGRTYRIREPTRVVYKS